jgi:hypothetical protein
MVKCSTLIYILDNTKEKTENCLQPLENFMDSTDEFLNSLFNSIEFEVDEKAISSILEKIK